MLGIKVVCGALLLPLASSGLLLNVLSMMVFCKQGLRQRINALLFCLACADFLLLVHFTMYAVDFFFTFHEGSFHIIGPVHPSVYSQEDPEDQSGRCHCHCQYSCPRWWPLLCVQQIQG